MSNFYKKVLNSSYPLIISEIGSNHNGNRVLMKKLIKESVLAGADFVKFQSWSKNTIFSELKYNQNFFLKDDYRKRKDINLKKIVDKYSASFTDLIYAKKISQSLGIGFSTSVFSFTEVDFAKKLRVPFIKIASMDLNNYPLLEYAAATKIPLIISTGLCNLHEIDKAISLIEKINNKIVILHCTSIYPPKDYEVNLNNIDTLKRNYPYPIGFSDHSLGVEIPLASVVKGVKIIEKHFTLNKNLDGWDHKVSADFEELKLICHGTKRIVDSMGSYRISSPESPLRKKEFRRSAFINKDKIKGEKIFKSDVEFKRPSGGISPSEYNYLYGRILKKNLKKESIIRWSDLV